MSQEPRKRKTFTLRLSKFELIHLRDLFSVILATETKQTVSQALAQVEERSLIESRLWQRVVKACKEAGIPLDDDAPDFVVAAAASPPVGVFRLATAPYGEKENEDNECAVGDGNPFKFSIEEDE
jgi:hypothetical protein